jgi:surface antigen
MKKSLLVLSVAIPLALAPTPGNTQSDGDSDLLDRIFTLGQPKASGQDREQVNQALDTAILNPGQAVDWRSPASGNSGTVVATRSYKNSLGYDCRDYRRTTISGQTETVHEGTFCKQLFVGWTLEGEKEVSSQTLARQPAVSAPPPPQPVPQQPVAAAPQTAQPAPPPVRRPAVSAPQPQQPVTAAPQTTQPVTPSVPPPVVITPPPPRPDPEVLATQKLLAQLGYDPGSADGQYGGKTRSAIEEFQRSQNLAVDGQVSSALLLDLVEASERKAEAPQTDSVTTSVMVPPPPPPLAPPPPPARGSEAQENENARKSEPKSPPQIALTRLGNFTRKTAESLVARLDHGEITQRYRLIDNQFLGTFRQQGHSYRKAVANYSMLLYGSDRDYKLLLQTKNWASQEGRFVESLKHDRDLIKAKLISVRLGQIGAGDLTKFITFSRNFEDHCKVTSKISVDARKETNCVLALGRWKFDSVTGIKGGEDRKSVAYTVTSVPNSISELIGSPHVTENRSAEFELHDDGWRLISR